MNFIKESLEKHLHIITHELPPIAGNDGLIEIHHTIKHLHRQGVLIHLHCFSQSGPVKEAISQLSPYCHSISIYPRKSRPSFKHWLLPFAISTRISDALVNELKKDQHPIFFEGLDGTYAAKQLAEGGRKLILRIHKAKHVHYLGLMRMEVNILQKLRFLALSLLWWKYESGIAAKMRLILTTNLIDKVRFENIHSTAKVKYLPVFTAFEIQQITGQGSSICYHADLSEIENEFAATWIIRCIASAIPERSFIIAGKNPSDRLKRIVNEYSNVRLLADPDDVQMNRIKAQVHIQLLSSFHRTGVNPSMIHALSASRFCVTNQKGSSVPEQESLFVVADNPILTILTIRKLFNTKWEHLESEKRKAIMEKLYDNEKNAMSLMQWIW